MCSKLSAINNIPSYLFKLSQNGYNKIMHMKMINVDELSRNSGHGDRVWSERSRANILEKSLFASMYPPAFDRAGLMTALSIMFDEIKTPKDFFEDVKLLLDTFFFPVSALSLAIPGKSKFLIKNVETYAGISRLESDWNLDNPGSLANYVRNNRKILIFPCLTASNNEDFLSIPFDYYKIYALETVDARNVERVKNLTPYASVSEITDYRLIRSERSKGTESGIPKFSSAVLAPLHFQNEFMGLMLFGFETIHSFTFADKSLHESNIPDLIVMVEHLAAILAKLRQ